MSSSSDASTIALLNNAAIQINRTLGIFIFIFGILGNIFNILVLRQRNLRSNPCSWFFFISSIASIITFLSGLTTRILSGWNLDFTPYNQILCKGRAFLVFTSPTITLWSIALATIDRWLSSSTLAHYRQKSTLKNAQRSTIVVVCLSAGLYIQMFICYEANLVNAPLKCYSKSVECRLVGDISFAFITILCPLFLMVLFGVLTIINVRQTRRRVHQRNNRESANVGNENYSSSIGSQQHRQKKIDRQLLIMLLFQVTLLTIFALPLAIQRFYSTLTSNNSQTTLQKTLDGFLYSLALLLLYIALGLPFYIYTLSGGTIFRKAVWNVLKMFRFQ